MRTSSALFWLTQTMVGCWWFEVLEKYFSKHIEIVENYDVQ